MNDKTPLTCASCGQQYAVENSDAHHIAIYCSVECEDDASEVLLTLIDRIENAIRSDDDNPVRNSERIIEAYERATVPEREVVDEIFTSLCGWTLKTLIAGKEHA